MASKKSPTSSSSKSSTSSTTSSSSSSASPVASPSPAMIDDSSFFRGPGGARLKTQTTLPPPPPTTALPTPDPNEYEKSVHHNVALTDHDLDTLKEQVRLLNGLPLKRPKQMVRHQKLRSPKVWPRATLTSRRRAELQQRRIILRCGNLKEKFDEYERLTKSSNSAALYRRLRQDAMDATNEQMDLLFEHRELENLKYLAERAKNNETLEYRDNQGSRLRFKFIRGEPIISSNFRDAFDDYMKPPFAVPRGIRQPKIYNLPKIDKREEIWLVPVDDDTDVPLHHQQRLPDPADKRTLKERARPLVKEGKRTPMSEWKDQKGAKRTGRRPWNFGGACPPNIGSH